MDWQHCREFTTVGHRCGRHLVVIVLLLTCAPSAVAQSSRVNLDFDSYMKQVAWSDITPSPTLRLQGGDDPRDIQAGDDSRESCLDWLLPRSHLPLPFLRGLAEGSGATLPLPIGTSFVSTELNRSVGVDNLRVGIGAIHHSQSIGFRREISARMPRVRYSGWMDGCFRFSTCMVWSGARSPLGHYSRRAPPSWPPSWPLSCAAIPTSCGKCGDSWRPLRRVGGRVMVHLLGLSGLPDGTRTTRKPG